MIKSFYDTIIVGAGPCGLALAQCLRHKGEKILLLESSHVMGGCHRVFRVPFEDYQLFTEHGPRVYFNNYENFKMLLRDMGVCFDSLFTPYYYTVQTELLRHVVYFSFFEILNLGLAFFLYLLNNNYGKKTTILQFAKKHKFSSRTMDVLDRFCRMTDGAGIDRYTVHQFFATMNQQLFASIYQPRMPNDKGLFRLWQDFLVKQDNIHFVPHHKVIHLSYNKETNLVDSVWVVDQEEHNTIEIKCHHVILAVPPHAMESILKTCHDCIKNSFMPFPRLERFVKNTEYIPYLSITFHWKQHVNTPRAHGFPVGEWGIIYIVLSDYMNMTNEYSKTLISCCISYLDRPSTETGKTANQTISHEEILAETFRQLKYAMPLLDEPDKSLISPQNSYYQGKWRQYDVSYVSSSKEEKAIKNKGRVGNLYNVGTHNGNSEYALTTLESAVDNAIFLAHQLHPPTQQLYPLQKLWTVRRILRIVLMVLLFVVLFVVFVLLFSIHAQKSKK